MHSHVSASHVNTNNQIGTKPKNRFFLNYGLRAVTYPKYMSRKRPLAGPSRSRLRPLAKPGELLFGSRRFAVHH